MKLMNQFELPLVAAFLLLLLSVTLIKAEEDNKVDERQESKTLNADSASANTASNDDDDDDDDDDGDGDHAANASEENGVLVLTDNNFDDVVNSKEFILVEFYAPWCGHCKQLAPQFEAAALKLKAATPPVALAKVDCTVESSLASRFDVSGYPTLKWFKNGAVQDYDGPRDEEGIVQYMKERTDPSWKPPPEEVVVLTKSNFTEVIERESLTIVMFYAPWCGHCKKMAPEYNKAAEELKKNKKDVVLAKVDATTERELAENFKVEGYPTMKMFRKGKEYKFTSDARDKWALMSYIEGQLGEASKELKTLDEVRKHVGVTDVSPVNIIAFFKSRSDPAFNLYSDAANELRDDYKFVHTFDEAARAHYKMSAGSVSVFLTERFHTKHEPDRHTIQLAADTTVEAVTNFITTHQVPLVGEYSQSTKDKVYNGRRPLVLFFYSVDWSFEHREATQKWRRKFADIAQKFKDYTFAVADEESNSDLFKEFGFDDSAEEINVGILDDKERRFPMKPMEEYDADDVINFINKFKKGQIKPKIKSSPAPKSQKKGAPYIIVGDTFEKIVLDETKDVLIELYAPWCGHCKKLEPIYAKLAKQLKSEKNLVIAKMDATVNEAPPAYESAGFPTIYFAPAGKKSAPIKYDGGERTLEALEKFIRDNAVVSMGKTKKDEL